jgi:hypothetical protein
MNARKQTSRSRNSDENKGFVYMGQHIEIQVVKKRMSESEGMKKQA